MSTSVRPPNQFVAVLKLPEDEVPLLTTIGSFIVRRMTGNSWFPDPAPPLAEVQSAIDDLSDAQTTTLSGLKSSFPARNEKRLALVIRLQHLRSYVETVANAHPAHGASIIESAGMYVKGPGGRTANVFAVAQGDVPGVARLTCPRARGKAVYEFQYSIDGMVTWIGLPPTDRASATIRGLTRASTVRFRYRTTVKGVPGDWSDPIAYVVR